MLTTSLIQGLEIIAVVSAMTLIVAPVLCWILPDRSAKLDGHMPYSGGRKLV
ncbi:MAG: hypothetical protein AAF609_21395 [Cyanobacteria bacterium P01_C01_bin.120]